MADVNNAITGIKALSDILNATGIGNTLIAVVIFIVLTLIGLFISIFVLMLKSNTNTTSKLLSTFENNQNLERQLQKEKFTEIAQEIKSLTDEMKKLSEKYNNTIENINCLIEMQSEKTIQAIVNDKPQSLKDFDRQCKHIIKSVAFESIDYVLDLVGKNSLYENKEIIAKNIMTKFQQDMQFGADAVDGLPFHDDKIKQSMFFKVDVFMQECYMEIVKAMDVGQKYDRAEIERNVRLARSNFVNKVGSLRFSDL